MSNRRQVANGHGLYIMGPNLFASRRSWRDQSELKLKRRVATLKRDLPYGETPRFRRLSKRLLHRTLRHGARVEVENEVRQAYLYNLPEPPALSPGDYLAETWTEEDQKRYDLDQRSLYYDCYDAWGDDEDYGVNYECHVETCKFCYPDPSCFTCGSKAHGMSFHDKVTSVPIQGLDFRPVDVELWAARDRFRPSARSYQQTLADDNYYKGELHYGS